MRHDWLIAHLHPGATHHSIMETVHEDQQKEAARAKEIHEQHALSDQNSLTTEQKELLRQHTRSLPAHVRGQPAVCERLCKHYARDALDNEIQCSDEHQLRLAEDGRLTTMFEGEKFESYEVGASSDDPVAYLKAEAQECAARGIKCDKRYSKRASKANPRSDPLQVVNSLKSTHCKNAARECVRVKREVHARLPRLSPPRTHTCRHARMHACARAPRWPAASRTTTTSAMPCVCTRAARIRAAPTESTWRRCLLTHLATWSTSSTASTECTMCACLRAYACACPHASAAGLPAPSLTTMHGTVPNGLVNPCF